MPVPNDRHHIYAPQPHHGIPVPDPEPLDLDPDPDDLAEFEDTLRRQRAEDGDEYFVLHPHRIGVW